MIYKTFELFQSLLSKNLIYFDCKVSLPLLKECRVLYFSNGIFDSFFESLYFICWQTLLLLRTTVTLDKKKWKCSFWDVSFFIPIWLKILIVGFQSPSKGDMPVIFYIHGGSLVLGTGAIQSCQPDFFMEFDVVIVTINYRLGPLGE